MIINNFIFYINIDFKKKLHFTYISFFNFMAAINSLHKLEKSRGYSNPNRNKVKAEKTEFICI